MASSENDDQHQPLVPSGEPKATPAATLRQPRLLLAGVRCRSGDPGLAAIIPPLQALVEVEERRRAVKERHRVVECPLHLHREGLMGQEEWSEGEQAMFVKKFKNNNFEDIAKALGRTVADCVKYYYRNKGRIFETGKVQGRLRLIKERKADFDLGAWEEKMGLAEK